LLPLNVERELDLLKSSLRALARAEPRDGADEAALYAFMDRTGDFITKLSLILDRIMNRIWEKYNSRAPSKHKANVYFPCVEEENKFPDALARLQLTELPARNPKLLEQLLKVQPFRGRAPWLPKLKVLAGLRHERPPEITENLERVVSPQPGKDFQIGMFIVKDGKVVEDEEAWTRFRRMNEADPNILQKIDASRMSIEQFRLRILEETGNHPIDFCKDCLAEVRSLARDIFRHMPR
jgi:hypothetical protein